MMQRVVLDAYVHNVLRQCLLNVAGHRSFIIFLLGTENDLKQYMKWKQNSRLSLFFSSHDSTVRELNVASLLCNVVPLCIVCITAC